MENKYIQFHDTTLQRLLPNTKYVSQTCYNTDQLNALGWAMIREFGSYHKVFWNCQTFVKCYLQVITRDHEANFSNWTLADILRQFLYVFLLGTPFATTIKVKENAQTEQLIKKIESIPDYLITEDKSARAMAAIHEALKQDPSWGSEVGKLKDTSD